MSLTIESSPPVPAYRGRIRDVRWRRLPKPTAGFTRTELLAVTATLGLLALVAVPLVANTKPRNDQVVCLNNLRQIGQGFHLWANDHGGNFPWLVRASQGGLFDPAAVLTLPGMGSYPKDIRQNVWPHFGWAYRELRSPEILACPSDPRARPASSFSTSQHGGYFSGGYQDNATSYFVSVHASPETPRVLLAGDRHLNAPEIRWFGCSVGYSFVFSLNNQVPPTAAWGNALHGKTTGNILLGDGSAEQRSSAEMATVARNAFVTEPSSHFLIPLP